MGGDSVEVSKKLRSKEGWLYRINDGKGNKIISTNNGTNSVVFNSLPGGFRSWLKKDLLQILSIHHVWN